MEKCVSYQLDLTKDQIEEIIMNERTIKQLEGTPNKVIIVPGKIINLVG
jgi:leucyl-tRNA synthetase